MGLMVRYLRLPMSENTGISREGLVTIMTIGGSGAAVESAVAFTQEGAPPTLSVVTTPLVLSGLSAGGGEIQANITLGGGATGWEATTPHDFITLSPPSGVSGVLTITYEENTGITREGLVTITTTGGSGSSVESAVSFTQTGSPPTLSVVTTPGSLSALSVAGGEIRANITLSGGTTGWEATSEDAFITLSSPNGVDGEVLTITYEANTGIAREGLVTIMTTGGTEEAASERIIFTQEGASPTLSVATTPLVLSGLSVAGGEIQANITLGGGATGWEATTSHAFITLSSPNGVDGEVLTITYDANPGISREGLVTITTIGGSGAAVESAVAFTQEGAPPTLSLATTPLVLSGLSVDGGEIRTNITLGGGATAWEATTSHAFITLSSPNGVDGEVLTITYDANPGISREGLVTIMTVGGIGSSVEKTVAFTQTSAPPTLSVETKPLSTSALPSTTGAIIVTLFLGGGATGWEATSDDDFITLAPTSGDKEENLTITYEKNIGIMRSGSVSIETLGGSGAAADTTLNITQEGAPHTISVTNIPTVALPFAQGTFTAAITLGGGATGWQATTTNDFLTLHPPQGTGNGSLEVMYTANSGESRGSSLTIMTTEGSGRTAKKTFILTQEGTEPTLTVALPSSAPAKLPATGGTITADIVLGGGATGWKASKNDDFITLKPENGGKADDLTITYGQNTGIERTIVITLTSTGGKGEPDNATLFLTQAGAPPTLSTRLLSGATTQLPASEGALMVDIILGGGATGWRASADDDFITFSPDKGGKADDLTIIYTLNKGRVRGTSVLLTTLGGSGTPAKVLLELEQKASPPTVLVTTTPPLTSLLSVDGGVVMASISMGGDITGWQATSSSPSDFITLDKSSGVNGETLLINYAANTEARRSGTVTIQTSGESEMAADTILTLTQQPAERFAAHTIAVIMSPESISNLVSDGGEIRATITLGGGATGWQALKEDVHNFISLTPSEGKKADILTITYEQNPSNIVRTANIILQTTGESGMNATKNFTLRQVGQLGTESVLLAPLPRLRLAPYPNPATSTVFIDSEEENAKIIIQHLHGARLLATEAKKGRNAIDISHLPEGVYILTLTNSKQSASTRLIKASTE